MVQKINQFFEKGHLALVFVLVMAFYLLCFHTFFGYMFQGTPEDRLFAGSFFFGAIVSSIFTFFIWLSRVASEFYRDCNSLEERVKLCTTKEELKEAFQSFEALRKRAFHPQMYSRLKEIHTRAETMYSFLPNAKNSKS
jgi:hypothetical protein